MEDDPVSTDKMNLKKMNYNMEEYVAPKNLMQNNNFFEQPDDYPLPDTSQSGVRQQQDEL